MEKQNIIILLQYLLIRIITWCISQYIFPDLGFYKFIENYRLYCVFFTISYITYYYLITFEEKKYQQIRFLILYINVYIFSHIFFRPILQIEHELFILLGVIITSMIILKSLTIKKHIKTVITYILTIIASLIICSGVIYVYPEAPNIEGFIKTQQLNIKIISDEEFPEYKAYVNISNGIKEEIIRILTGTQEKTLRQNGIISFISNQEKNGDVFIIFPNGDVLQIYPRSQHQIILKEDQFFIETLMGSGGKYLTNLNNNTLFDKSITSIIDKDTANSLAQPYFIKLKLFLKKQIGNNFWTNNINTKISEITINILSTFLPSFFPNNKNNFNEFQKYIKETGDGSYINKYTIDIKKNSLRSALKSNFTVGSLNSYFN